jgi:hypothetical protein
MSDADSHDADGPALAEIDRVLQAAFPTSRGPHLDEDAIIAVCRGGLGAGPPEHHLQECPECRQRAALACQLLGVDGLDQRGRSQAQADWLLARLEAALQAERRPASLRVRLDRSGGVVARAHRLEVLHKSGPALALRRPEDRPTAPTTHFRRRFGSWDVSLEIGCEDPRFARGGDPTRFELLVRAAAAADGADGGRPRGRQEALLRRPVLALLEGDRELAVEPALAGRVCFRNLLPGRYVLELREGRLAAGRVVIELELTGS